MVVCERCCVNVIYVIIIYLIFQLFLQRKRCLYGVCVGVGDLCLDPKKKTN